MGVGPRAYGYSGFSFLFKQGVWVFMGIVVGVLDIGRWFCSFGFMEALKRFNEIFYSEDDWNNFLIDCWVEMNKKSPTNPQKYQYLDGITGEIIERDEPMPAITITITPLDFYK